MTERTRGRVLAASVVTAALAICVAFVDRPVATWFDERFHTSMPERAFVAMFVALDYVLPIAGVVLIGLVIWFFRTKRTPPMVRHVVAAGSAATLALGVALVLKTVIGRSQVYPTFLRDGIYTMHFMRGGPLYGAFPSATMAGVLAFICGLGLPRRVERIAVTLLTAMLTLALLITSGHWLSDIIGGSALGMMMGRAVAHRFFAHR